MVSTQRPARSPDASPPPHAPEAPSVDAPSVRAPSLETTSAHPDAGRFRRVDPGRRDRIVEACLDVIAADGVAGTSHRKVAAAAGVPLGSMTYHFSGIDELLREAFTRFADRVADGFDRSMTGAADPAAARRAVVALVLQDVLTDRRDLAITLELYSLAARRAEYRVITDAWMARSRAALGRHFDPVVTTRLDALIEGLTIHRALSLHPVGGEEVTAAVDRITRPSRPSRVAGTSAGRVGRRLLGRGRGT